MLWSCMLVVIVEKGTAIEVFKNPLHPYTVGLMKSKTVVNRSVDRLYTIPWQRAKPNQHAQLLLFQRPLQSQDGSLQWGISS